MSTELWPLPWLGDAHSKLQQAKETDRLAHALLFVGPEGVGKLALARAFCRDLFCRQAGEGACGNCDACAQFDNGSHPDFRHLQPDEKTGNFKIESIRALGHELALTSQYGGYRVAILEGVEGFTEGAANALLKTLEEPPQGVILMLLTPWPGRLMATVRSRCQLVRCPAPEAQLAGQWLQQKGINDPEAALERAGGSPLLALKQEADGELIELMQTAFAKLANGGIGLVAAAKFFEAFHARVVAAAMLARLEQEVLQQVECVANGSEIACLGGKRSAQAVFRLRDQLLAEYRHDPTGLNQQAALERLMMLVVRGY